MSTEGVWNLRLSDIVALNDSMEMSSIVDQREAKRGMGSTPRRGGSL